MLPNWEISIRDVPLSGLQVVLMAAQLKNAKISQKLCCQISRTELRQAARAHIKRPMALKTPTTK